MALLWADGFDHYGTGDTAQAAMLQGDGAWALLPNDVYGGYPVTTRSRTGTHSMFRRWRENAGSDYPRRVIVSTSNEVGQAFGIYFDALPSDSRYVSFAFLEGTTPISTFYVSAAGAILVYDGTHTGTLVDSSDNGVITAGAFNHVEIRMLRDSVVGELECRVNGEVVAFANNLDLGATNADGFGFRKGLNGIGPDSWIDDMVCWDGSGTENNTFVGQQRVNLTFLTADTAQADWTPNTGDGYATVDDVTPDGDTTYIQAGTAGQISEFEVGTLPSEVDLITGIYIPAMSKLVEAGSGEIQVSMVSNGQVANGPETPLTTAYSYWGSVFELNPDGNIPWTKATFEASLVRVEKTA